MKKLLIILLLVTPFIGNAISLAPLPEAQPTWFQKTIHLIERCKINPFCYFRPQAGSISLTNISGSTSVSAYPAIQNANNAIIVNEINNMTASSTNTSLTSAANLTTIGTVTSGTWNATTIAANKGGTGQTSYTTGDILYASGASALSKLAIGSNGQVLTLTAGLPAWVSGTFDQTANYTLTGNWLFQGKASTTNVAALDTLYVGRTASSTIQGSTSGTSVLQGFLNILGTGVGTSTVTANLQVSGNATTSRLTVSNGPNQGCVGCINAHEVITATAALNGGSPSTVTVSPACTAGKVVLGGGYDLTASSANCTAAPVVFFSKPNGTTGWTASFSCNNGATTNISAYAICAIP